MAATPRSSAPFALPVSLTTPDLLAKYFKVLSDPTRVRILELLQERGEPSVSELVEALGQAQPKASNHLACLRWCGFVLMHCERPSVCYRVADQRVLDVLALGRALLSDNSEHVAACARVEEKGMLMRRQAEKPGEAPKSGPGVGVLSAGILATLVVCCAGQALRPPRCKNVGRLGGPGLQPRNARHPGRLTPPRRCSPPEAPPERPRLRPSAAVRGSGPVTIPRNRLSGGSI